MSITIGKNENKELVLEACDADFYDELPNSLKMVKEIAPRCFIDCAPDKINIPININRIGLQAFANGKLQEITFSGNTLVIEHDAFKNNPITKLNLPSCATIEANAFEHNAIEKLFIPNGVKLNGGMVFGVNTNLKEVVIEEGFSDLPDRTFMYCCVLKDVKLPSSIRRIEDYTFGYCRSLESIEIPEGVRTICWSAFRHCENLTKVTFPSTLKEIKDEAFYDCPNLKSVIVPLCCQVAEGAFDEGVEVKYANYDEYRIIKLLIDYHSQKDRIEGTDSQIIIDTLQNVLDSKTKTIEQLQEDTLNQ